MRKLNRSAESLAGKVLLAGLLLAATPQSSLAGEKKELFVPQTNSSIMVTTTDGFDGYRVKEYRGIVRGVTVRQPTIGQGLKAELKGIVGGKMGPFISMCETARQAALDIMMERTQAMGANAVVGLRYDSSAFGESDDMGSEVVCYGTAVVIEQTKDAVQKTASLDTRAEHTISLH